MRSHNDSIDTTRTPPPLSFYNTFKQALTVCTKFSSGEWPIMFTTMSKKGGDNLQTVKISTSNLGPNMSIF